MYKKKCVHVMSTLKKKKEQLFVYVFTSNHSVKLQCTETSHILSEFLDFCKFFIFYLLPMAWRIILEGMVELLKPVWNPV